MKLKNSNQMYVLTWNYNTNRNNMKENPLLYTRLNLQVVYCLKRLKYFEVMLTIFELSESVRKCRILIGLCN